MDSLEQYIENVLRPKIQGDGGEMVFVRRKGKVVYVQLKGECSKCGITERCLQWAQEQVKKDLQEEIEFSAQKIKPFFWDK